MIVKDMRLTSDFQGGYQLTLTLTNKQDIKVLQELQHLESMDLTLKKHSKKRSQTQNSYLWFLSNEIAKKLGTSDKEVYQKAIREVGVYELIPIKNEAVEMMKKSWESKGEGWICDELRDAKFEGYKTLKMYYGSSVYDSTQMARLISEIVLEAQYLGIETMTISEVERLKNGS